MPHPCGKLHEVTEKWWNTVCLKIPKAVVYADGPSSEFLHWHGGLHSLLARGALNIQEFPSQIPVQNEKRAVVLLSGPLHGEALSQLERLVKANSFQSCVVITSASPSVHLHARYGSGDAGDELNVFYSLEDRILEWMGNMNFTAEVIHVPTFLIPITSEFFLMPPFSTVFPLLPWETPAEAVGAKRRTHKPLEMSCTHLPQTLQIQVKHLVCSLNSLFEELDVHEEIFSVGCLSRAIAADLENLAIAKNRRKVAKEKAMVLFVDRTVDLAGPLSQETQTMIDRIVRVLPRRHRQNLDVEVDMSAFCSAHQGKGVAKGCLAHEGDTKAASILNMMLTKRQRDFLVEANRHLVDVASKGGIKMDISMKTGRLSPDLLEQRISYLRQNPKVMVECSGFIQTVLAAVQALKDPANAKLDGLQSSEKLLMQNMDVSEEGPSRNLVHLISHRKQSSLMLTDLIGILAFLFALNGENAIGDKDDEAKVQMALVEAMFQDMDDGLPQFLADVVGESQSEMQILDNIRFLFNSLKSLGSVRQDFKKYRKVFYTGSTSEPAHYRPFLKQLVDDLLRVEGTELADVDYHSGGLRDKLKSGFSLFMNVSKPQPRSYPTIFVVVVGGITGNEVRLIREAIATHRVDSQVIVGSTMLCTPERVLQRIFAKCNA